jgi:hypothetical protein
VTKQRIAGRDLDLTYGVDDTQSPDLPIFGRTAAHQSQQQQQQHEQGWLTGALPSADADQVTPEASATAAAAAYAAESPVDAMAGGTAAAAGDDEDTTGQLYSSLIHSNMGGMSSRDVDMQEDQAAEPGTTCT